MKTQKTRPGFSVLSEAARAIDAELDRVMKYVNGTVVPAARGESEVLLRRASDTLRELADRLAVRAREAAREGRPDKDTQAQAQTTARSAGTRARTTARRTARKTK